MTTQTIEHVPTAKKQSRAKAVARREQPTRTAVAVSSNGGGSAAFLAMVERVALDPNASVERVRQMFDLYREVEADAARKLWVSAFAELGKSIESVVKDANNKQTSSNYASFDALDTALRPHLTKHGFNPTYATEPCDKPEHVTVVMYLMHTGGHERRYAIDMPCDGKGAKGGDVMTKTHAVGSAFSYGKRYLLGGATGIASRDDDGNAAGGKPKGKTVLRSTVSDEQIETLRGRIANAGITEAEFLAVGGFSKIEDLPAIQFKAACDFLNQKINERG